MESNSKSVVRNAFIKQIEVSRKLNFTEKRLMKDLEEIEEKVDPSLGISAQPLKDNLMKWHANIRGPEGTAYEGTILHMEFRFPKDYPNSAPEIVQLVPFTSPFFQKDKFVTEMVGEDWCSGFSVESLLM